MNATPPSPPEGRPDADQGHVPTLPVGEGPPSARPMFQGIRYGRPGQNKFNGRLFLLMILIGAALTWLLNAVLPEPPPPPDRPVEVRFGTGARAPAEGARAPAPPPEDGR